MRRRMNWVVIVGPSLLASTACGDPEGSDKQMLTAEPSAPSSGMPSSPTSPSNPDPTGSSPGPVVSPTLGSSSTPQVPPTSPAPGGGGTPPSMPSGTDTGMAAAGGESPAPMGGMPGVAGSGGSAGAGDAGMGGAAGGSNMTAGTGGQGGNLSAAGSGGSAPDRPKRVLLYHFSTLDIPSVPAQLGIYGEWMQEWGFEVDESDDPAVLTNDNLANYAAVGMINTCFSPFGQNQSGDGPEAQALSAFVQAGGGLFGAHCASVTFQGVTPVPLYNELLGGRASNQYFEGVSPCRTVAEHPVVTALPETFDYNGNLDATSFIAEDTTVLVQCNFGDGSVSDVPVSWVRTEGQGRVFFSSFAKVDGDLRDATIGEAHMKPAFAWVLWQ